MSLLSNPNITRYGITYSWNTDWVEYNNIYKSLIYTDIYINEFINGIYYKLKKPTALPVIKNIGYNKIIILVKSLTFYEKKRYHKWIHFIKRVRKYQYMQRRLLFYFNRILIYNNKKKNNKIYNINYIKNKIKYNNKKNNKINVLNNILNNKRRKLLNNNKKKYNYFYNNYKKINIKKIKNKKIIINTNKKKLYFINKYKFLIKTVNKYNKKIKNRILKKIKKKKYHKKKIISLKKNINKIINIKINQLFIIFNWLLFKLINYIYYIILNFIINTIYIKKIQLFKININSISIISVLNKIYIVKNKIFNIINEAYITKKNKTYSRLRSYYRIKQIKEREYKKKIMNKRFPARVYIHYMTIILNKKKWITNFNINIYNKHLNLKINNTLNLYLNKNIYYINKNNTIYFSRIDNPKLLVEYIKILMKYEQKSPSILKNIVKRHSMQKKKKALLSKYHNNLLKKSIYKLNNKLFRYTTKKFTNLIYNNKRTKLNLFVNKREVRFYKRKKIFNIKKKYKNNNKLYLNSNKLNNIMYLSINNKRYKKYNIRNIKQKNNIFYINKNNYNLNILDIWISRLKTLIYKKYPLIGIRIELSGPSKKGRRTQTYLYNEWVDFYTLPGKMPLVNYTKDIQYWQSYGLTQRASIGIKVWNYFYTPKYSLTTKKKIND